MQRIVLIATLFTLAAWSADAAEVRLKSEAACSGAVVRLKDVAEVVSEDENEAAALAELQLFPVPSSGKTRSVRPGEIRELLALSGVNMQSVTLSGAEKLTVRRAGTASPAKPQATAAEVVPSAYITPSTKVARSTESSGIELVPMATRALDRGSLLRATDLELRPATSQRTTGSKPLKVEDLVGQELLRPVPAGQQVLADFVQSPRLVRKNDKVRIKAIGAGVVISTDGKSLAEGGLGDNVLVEDFATKEKIVTRITGYQLVEVLGTGVKQVR
jgi:flagellar basal body P-ring formation protein FlgA